jgi:hypothetical protein
MLTRRLKAYQNENEKSHNQRWDKHRINRNFLRKKSVKSQPFQRIWPSYMSTRIKILAIRRIGIVMIYHSIYEGQYPAALTWI